ncbi:MAG TPA: phospholipase D-like domain-containing protein [Polyangia bacterium]|nr:phospholipase D-like domain-containing protein [Polyangia bacterium]
MSNSRSTTRFGFLKGKAAVAVLSSLLTLVAGFVTINLLPGEKRLEQPVSPPYAVQDAAFGREMGELFGPPLVAGNRVEPLENGAQIFPAMLEAIRGAQRSVNFETYIYWSGRVGTAFADAMSERARAGVKVHLILDAVGSGKISADALKSMRAAGVEIERYHAPTWHTLDRLNNRTHRKLLIVDGRVGFTGGVGIADKWDGSADSPDHWRDSHFRLEGPAVAEMQSTFVDHWLATRGVLLQGADYFPELAPRGDMRAQMIRSSVEDSAESVYVMYLLSIAAARKSILLSNSYFVPDHLMTDALVAAQRRGVDVQIIVPGPDIDSDAARAASRRGWGPLLEAGIAIYEFQPTMFHCKVMVVDDVWTSIGSTNFDSRSFKLNDEANLNVLDSGLAARERRTFEADRARAGRITLEAWKARPLWQRFGEWLADGLRSQL